MNEWCKGQFGWDDRQKIAKPGLLADQASEKIQGKSRRGGSLATAVHQHVEEKCGILAGNTVNWLAEQGTLPVVWLAQQGTHVVSHGPLVVRFVNRRGPKFMGTLHYRIVDVSTVKDTDSTVAMR
eukprot:Skav221766  [mRNA]  locus=scaffold490:303087:306336:+ [translate_table: standard]